MRFGKTITAAILLLAVLNQGAQAEDKTYSLSQHERQDRSA